MQLSFTTQDDHHFEPAHQDPQVLFCRATFCLVCAQFVLVVETSLPKCRTLYLTLSFGRLLSAQFSSRSRPLEVAAVPSSLSAMLLSLTSFWGMGFSLSLLYTSSLKFSQIQTGSLVKRSNTLLG